MSVVIAIDGPAGSGKSTVARAVARELGLALLDTGAMYRAVAWRAIAEGIDLADPATAPDVVRVARDLEYDASGDPDDPRSWVGGDDVTDAIRAPEISRAVSHVATNLAVREVLVARQRAWIDRERTGGHSGGRGAIAEGRDITTVVAPDAEVRILLTASPRARVRRRALDLHGRADEETLQATASHVLGRDEKDSTVVDFTHAAPGVVELDTSDLSLLQTVQAVIGLVRQEEEE